MVMILWWVTPLLVLAALGLGALAYTRRHAERRRPVIVANSDYLERMPSYLRARRRSKIFRVASLGFAVLGVLGSSFLGGRIASERVEAPSLVSRDIVLCLDVSGSMYEYDAEIMKTFASMVDGFEGERIGLSIFNSTSRTVFPLTSDYVLAKQQLTEGSTAIDYDEFGAVYGSKQYTSEQEDAYYSFIAGTRGVENSASLIPDGLASCGQLFDGTDESRQRTVIVATDNEVNGSPIYTLDEAFKTLDDRNVTVFTLYPGQYECGTSCGDELQRTTEDHGGSFYENSDPDAVPSMIAAIEEQQAAKVGQQPRVVRSDLPGVMFTVSLIALAGVILSGWWLKR